MTTRELVQMLLLKQLVYLDQSLERDNAQPPRLVESLSALSEAELLDIDAAISTMPIQQIKNLCWLTARVISGGQCTEGRLPLVAEVIGTQPFNVDLVVRQLAKFHLKITMPHAETYLWRAVAGGLVPIDLSGEFRFTERLARVSTATFIGFNPFAQALMKRSNVRDQFGAATNVRF